METLKYEDMQLSIVRLIDKMTIDQIIQRMLNRHRERYAYHIIDELELKEMQRNALLYISDLGEQNPDWDLADVRTMLEGETQEPYERRLERSRGTALYGIYRAQLYMVMDADFREDMLALYEGSVGPGLKRFELYDKKLQELTGEVVYALSHDELTQFAVLYGTYRNAGSDKREGILQEAVPQYARLAQNIYAFEDEYGDIIERDIVNVRGNIHRDLFREPLDVGSDSLRREEYGILFPYLHLAKTLYSLIDTRTGYID